MLDLGRLEAIWKGPDAVRKSLGCVGLKGMGLEATLKGE